MDTEQGRGRIFYTGDKDFSLEPLFSSNVDISRSLRPWEILFLSWAPSLRSKRFRLVSKQRKTEERDFRSFLVLCSETARKPFPCRLRSSQRVISVKSLFERRVGQNFCTCGSPFFRGTQREYSSKPLNIALLNVF